jgi:hypothetical protein
MRVFLALSLLPALALSGCKESPGFVKSGPLFAAAEKAPPGKALVYVYWPREEQGRRKRIWVTSCEGAIEEILPGGFTAFTVEPGSGCFKAEAQWDLKSGRGVASLELATVKMDIAAGQTYFVRLEQEPFLFTSRFHLRPIQLAAATPEIRRCRRSVELSSEEMVRNFAQDQR